MIKTGDNWKKSTSTNLCHEFFVHCTWKTFIQALCTPGHHTCCNVNVNGCLCKSIQQKLFVDNILSCKKPKQKTYYQSHTDFHNLILEIINARKYGRLGQ